MAAKEAKTPKADSPKKKGATKTAKTAAPKAAKNKGEAQADATPAVKKPRAAKTQGTKTFLPTREQALKDRAWVVVDAANQPLGRVASQVAAILRGKNKPTFTPHVDTGDFVVVLNASKIVLTGNKLKNKIYYRYTNYIGGLKAVNAEDFLAKDPAGLVTRAVKGMLPQGPLGFAIINKLKVYPGTEHPHKAQEPKTVTVGK